MLQNIQPQSQQWNYPVTMEKKEKHVIVSGDAWRCEEADKTQFPMWAAQMADKVQILSNAVVYFLFLFCIWFSLTSTISYIQEVKALGEQLSPTFLVPRTVTVDRYHMSTDRHWSPDHGLGTPIVERAQRIKLILFSMFSTVTRSIISCFIGILLVYELQC